MIRLMFKSFVQRLGKSLFFLNLLLFVNSDTTANVRQDFYLIDLASTINPGTTSLLKYAIAVAEQDKAQALIVRLNTPGGLISSTRAVVSTISESKVPVLVYVAPFGASATSAGSFILLSSHFAMMHEGTNVGAASPVSGSGSDITGTMAKKVMNDTRAFMKSLATSRGKNQDVAEKFVTEALSLTADEALTKGVIDKIIKQTSPLLDQLHGLSINFNGQTRLLSTSGRSLITIDPRLVDLLLAHLGHPQIAYLLVSMGALGLQIELFNPGMLVPGIFGAISLMLGLICLQSLPISIGFLGLLFLGVVLMVAEYFVAGFGVLGIGGAIAFILGSLNLFSEPLNFSGETFQESILWLSMGIGTAMVLLTLTIAKLGLRNSAKESPLNKTGMAMLDFQKEGHILIGPKRWAAETQDPLRKGDKVTVIALQGSDRVLVKRM
jgi:membrane-bound serine protease (ClpP class)